MSGARALVHVDLDGAEHIYRSRGWTPTFTRDALFESGMSRMMSFFEGRNIVATLFVIAEDLKDRAKRSLIMEAVARGHEIASHTMTHRRLTQLAPDECLAELRDSRAALEDAIARPVVGFRAPGFALDAEALKLVAEAGYRYDSSVFCGSKAPAGALTMSRSLMTLQRDTGLRELALPRYDGLPWPFHASYSLLLGTRYFRAGFERAMKSPTDPFVFLVHLTDLADPMPAADLRGLSSRVFTLSVLSASTKERRLGSMIDLLQSRCPVVPTASLFSTAAAQ